MRKPALVIIARAPELGHVKSRLAAGIGAVGALDVYRQLLWAVRDLQACWPGAVLLTSSGNDATWTGSGLEHLPRRTQDPGGLGSRIAQALHWGLATAGSVVAIGTDCPGMRAQHLAGLVTLLDTAPVVFGPAMDGGYWGVAVSEARVIPPITSDDLPWSTGDILAVSRTRLQHSGYHDALGDTLSDCDDVQDLSAAVALGWLRWPTPLESCS